VVADDHPFFRDGVIRGLTMSGRVEVVAEADDGREALEAIRRERPDVALVDHEMPDVDGLGVVRATVRDGPADPRAAARRTPTADRLQALEAGAAGYLSRTRGAPRSSRPSWTWRAGRRSCRPGRRGPGGEIRLRAQSSGPALSERERQVLQGFARASCGTAGGGGAVPLRARSRPTRSGSTRSWASPTARAAVAEGMRRGLVEERSAAPTRRVDAARVPVTGRPGGTRPRRRDDQAGRSRGPITRFTIAIATAAAIGSPPSSGTTTAAAVDRPMIQPR
jgi:two-component system nitrate/nitrite response regulator NarL